MRIDGIAFASCARSHQIWIHHRFETRYFGVYLEFIRMTEITNCTFQDSFGSALGVVASHVSFKGSTTFSNNSAMYGCGVFADNSSVMNFQGSTTFSNNSASLYGGGVFADNSSVMNFKGSTTFSNNSAGLYGGGVYAHSSSVMNFKGSTTFSNNSASWYGGGVYARSSSVMNFKGSTTFSNNSASVYGGGVYASSSSAMSFNGSTTFFSNSAKYGGGVSASFSSAMSFSGSTTFSNNSYGGGVYASYSSVMNFKGSTTFSNNSASWYGDGVYARSSSVMNFKGSNTFSNNSASVYGGGVYAVSSSVMNFKGSTTFNNNSASGYGGGVYASSSSAMSFNGSTTFCSNSAKYGGGVYASSSSAMSFSGSTTFSNNSASRDGGGVSAFYSSVIFDGSTTFSSNSASGDGGGVYAPSSSVMNFKGSTTFNDNSASVYGGGVYASSSSVMNFNGSTTFSNNSASRDGGGVYASSSSAMRFNGSTTISSNSGSEEGGGVYATSSSVISFNGSTTFSNNSASRDGGGVSASSSSAMRFNGSTTFSSNSGSEEGGGVYATSSSVISFNGSTTFSNNSARYGGGVYESSSSVMSFNGSTTFSNNSARYGGGVYESSSSVMSFNGSTTFSGNSASNGGGIYTYLSPLNLYGDYIFNANSAGYSGGGIYTCYNQLHFSGTCVLSENTAELDGGGLYTDGGNLNLSGSITITNNTAGLGGGIYSDNGTINVYGCNVEGNIAAYNGGGLYVRRTLLVLAGNNMFNANSAGEGGGIFATVNTTLDFDGVNSFTGNRAHVSGGGIWLDNSNLSMNGNNCFVECGAAYEGGGIFSYASNATLPGNNTFVSNSATTGGGIHARWSNVGIASISNTAFRFNTAVFGAGIFTDNSTFEFSGVSNITNNHASHTGGGMYAARSILNFLATSSVTIIANDAVRDGGGMYTRDGCVVKLHGFNSYENNSAEDTGGGISAFRSSFNFSGHNTFTGNKAVTGGGFYAFNSSMIFPGENDFIANSAISHGGGVAATRSTLNWNGLATVKNNSALSGGGFNIDHSTMEVDGQNYFVNNTANSEGGATRFSDSQVEFTGRSIFVANTAGNKGAAIHTSFTTLIFEGTSSFVNNSANYGGGILSESSNITFVNLETSHHMNVSQSCISYENCCDISNFTSVSGSSFLNNRADRGGALYLDQYSNFSLHLATCIHFQGNRATEFGGAIYIVDASGPGQFLPQQYMHIRRECFLYILGKEQPSYQHSTPLVFKNNFAGIRGSALYGGLLGKCNLTSMKYSSALDFFRRSVVQNSSGSSISSDPTQICFCSRYDRNCSVTIQPKSIYPGQDIEVSVIAVDQSGVAIPTLVHVNVRSGKDHNVTEKIITYETGSSCTNRNYSAPPTNIFNQLELYPNNRSGSTVQLIVNITFENCPIGFEQSNFSGECICDHRLWQFTNTCDIDTQSILRPGGAIRSFWLGVALNNGTPEGFIHHRYCPLDYCIREDKRINLKHPDDQCSFNRSGLLCGQCRRGLSLVLGSSQCKKCTNTYLALLIPFALAGVLLVTLLFLLHLTVAEGTLHGLIFYANIVEANHHIFFPQSSINPASTFIAWLNLDLGIKTCFYDGMDGYARAWLEYVFPVYIWGIVGFLVYISDRSARATKLLGSSPVPVLATLFLLSYAKLLRTIIAMLSLTTLYYPYRTEIVWVQDANIPLTKYIPLVLVAVLFLLLLFLPYTLLLLVGQWLQPKSHLCFLSWVRNPKVKAILDSYHAPYKLKYRYWTGLLLLLRCALYLVFAFNVTGNDSINLLIISATAVGTPVAFGLAGMVYKSWYLNALELSFILNLGILSAATYHVNQSGGSQAAIAYTSVGIAFLTFVGIVGYHIFWRIKSKMQYIQRGRQLRCRNNKYHQIVTNDPQPAVTPTITHTVVDLQELRSPLDLLDTK